MINDHLHLNPDMLTQIRISDYEYIYFWANYEQHWSF